MRPFVFPSIGIDISDESFKYMRLENRHGIRELGFYGTAQLEKGIVEAGEIKDIKALAIALKQALSKYKMREPYVVLSLPEEKGFLRLIRMQYIPESEVRQALEFQLEEHIPYPPAELYFDYRILPGVTEKKKEMDVVVMAYPKEIINSYITTIKQAGYIPIVFELESQAVARAVVPADSKDAVLIGDLGKTRTTFSIVYKGVIHFSATVKVGGRDIDAILQESLHVSPQEASEIKIGRGFDISSDEIIKSLSPALTSLKEEADRQIGFWERRSGKNEPQISHIYLCGGDAHLKGMPEFLSRELNVGVSKAHIGENIFDLNTYIPPLHAHDTLLYATAFGLAMRSNSILFSNL